VSELSTTSDVVPSPWPAHFVPAVEAMLLAAEKALRVEEIAELLNRVDEVPVPLGWVEGILQVLLKRHSGDDRGFHLMRLGDAWEFRTRGAYSDYVHVMYRKKPVRLSRAALEVLAVVAYRQPCTRADVDDIRGVDSSATLRQLLERDLVRIIGKSDDVGRPLLYATTAKFLSFFGLSGLTDLPTLKEYTELSDENLVKLQELDATLAANASDAAGAPSQAALRSFVTPALEEMAAAAAQHRTELQPELALPALSSDGLDGHSTAVPEIPYTSSEADDDRDG
jgi:segregation and condensation protein B